MRDARCGADRFGRDAEMVAERAGESFVRAVVRIQREAENIGRTGGQLRPALLSRRART